MTNMQAISEICRLASAEGLTYGKYVAKYRDLPTSKTKKKKVKEAPTKSLKSRGGHRQRLLSRPINRITAEGEVLEIYPSLCECARRMLEPISPESINYHCRRRAEGKKTTPVKGIYYFEFAKEVDNCDEAKDL